MMTKYVPKRIHFNHEGMEARTQLAALDNNSNVGRQHAVTSTGDLRYKSQFSRHKGDYVAKKIFEEKSYEFAHQLMQDVHDAAIGKKIPVVPKHHHVSISRQQQPPKADVVARLQSRMRRVTGDAIAEDSEEEDA